MVLHSAKYLKLILRIMVSVLALSMGMRQKPSNDEFNIMKKNPKIVIWVESIS